MNKIGEIALTSLIASLVTISGWFVFDHLASDRTRRDKIRELRFEYIINTYRQLASAVQREPMPGSKYFRFMEAAASDIQLFGTEKQIEYLNEFLDEYERSEQGPADKLLFDLRADLRREMGLSKAAGIIRWFRPEGGVIPDKGQNPPVQLKNA
jgi:hypothetical protein